MFYAKKLPRWERAIRITAGLSMLACGLIGFQGLVIGYAIAGAGVVTLLTGFVGFCPMCSMVGWRLDKRKS